MAQTAPPPPSTDKDWAADAADKIEQVVTAVRDKTTVPIQKVARVLVYGLVVGFVGATALVLVLILLFRLHVYLPFHPEGRRVWTSYVGLGAIFVVLGGLLWRKRSPETRG